MRDSAVARPERSPHGAQAKLGAAALVGDREAVAADGEHLAADPAEADAAGADDDDRPVLAGMGAEIGDRRVAREPHRFETEHMLLEAGKGAAAVEAGNSDAGVDRRALADPGFADRLAGRLLDRLDRDGEAGGRVARARFAGAQHCPVARDQAGPGMSAARVYSEI